MARIVQPPILMSRILTFVLATSIVVLVALVIALTKMIPLERPEVFFLLTPTTSVNTVIEPLVPSDMDEKAMEYYEEGFVREYIILRNTLLPNAAITKNNWSNIIKQWSSDRVYSALTRTALYKEYTSGEQIPSLSCSVNFSNSNKEKAINNTTPKDRKDYSEYIATFAWVCKNSGGQTTQKNYMIRIRIQSVLDKNTSGPVGNLNKLRNNPLGTRVTEYTVLRGDGDPLNSDRNTL